MRGFVQSSNSYCFSYSTIFSSVSERFRYSNVLAANRKLKKNLADAENVINELKAREEDFIAKSKSEISDLTNQLEVVNDEFNQLEDKYDLLTNDDEK